MRAAPSFFFLFVPITTLIIIIISLTTILVLSSRYRFSRRKRQSNVKTIAFFHPFCAAGGGGERVLWKAIQAIGDMQSAGLQVRVVVYTKDAPSLSYAKDILKRVQETFSITISSSLPLVFVHLHEEYARQNSSGPAKRFSLLVESIDSMRMAWAALDKVTPDVFMDTTGCAFTYVVASLLAGCRVAAYVHYPTISTDMLAVVWERRPTNNTNNNNTPTSTTNYLKLVYYLFFALCYGMAGSFASLVMVNSTWTRNHIRSLWRFRFRRTNNIQIVYPPCDTKSLEDLCDNAPSREQKIVLSIAQFRPEKDHALQIQSFAILIGMEMMKDVELVLVGSCRNEEDEGRVDRLRALARELGIADSVTFAVNEPYSVLKQWLGRASVGLHTMWNEHFGIGVVEMMAAGLITVAHNSGGPKSDIIVPYKEDNDTGRYHETGYLACTAQEFAHAMHRALTSDENDTKEMRFYARESAKRFSDDVFTKSFKSALLTSNILR